MRTFLLVGVVCGLMLACLGCGSSDSGDSDAVASSSGSAPPPPPTAASPSAAPSAPGASGSGAEGSESSGAEGAAGSSSAGYPGGSGPPGGYPGASGPPGGYPGGSGPPGGYPGASAPPGYPDGAATPGGYPGGTAPAGGYPGASSGEFPGAPGYSGSPDGAGGFAIAPPPRPKSLREKAVDAFRAGRGDEGSQLLAAHYLTNPKAGSELARVMQYSPGLRKPTLVTRIGLAVVYSSQPASYEGHPQPIGSPELEASLASLERKTDGGGNREGGNPRVGGGIRRRGGGDGNPGAAIPPGGSGGEGIPGYGGGNNQLPTSPQEELAYFTGEVGTKLVDKIKAKLEAGDFGAIYREALKDLPLAKVADGEGGQFGSGDPRAIAPPGAAGISGPPIPGAGFGPPGAPGRPPGAEGGADAKGGGVITGQLIPGVEFLGAAQNVKELGDLIKASSVDAVIYFEVRVRPASAIAFVNNDTKLRLVASSEPTKQLYASAALNNKQVHEIRKKRGAEDPVAKELDAAIAALETNFKLAPLRADLTPELAMQRLTYLIGQKPEDATPLLLEARLYVAKKLLKADDVVTLVLTAVTEEQLDALSEALDEGDIKEQIGAALTGKSADAPTTVLGKFGAALGGAGGLGNLVPTPQFPPGGLPGAMPPGGFPQPGTGPGGYPGASGPPSGYPQGSGPPGAFPQPGGPPASKGSSQESR